MRRIAVLGALIGCYHDPGNAPLAQNQVAIRAPGYAAAIADPLGFLPIDSELVVSIDARAIRASPLWQHFGPTVLAKLHDDLAEFQQRCGIDVVASLTRASFGLRDLGHHHSNGVIVIHGLERAKVIECVQRGPQPPVRSGEAFVVRAATAGENDVAFQFVGDRTFVAVYGPSLDERALATVLAAGAPLRGSPTFTSLVERVDTHQAVWFVVNGNSKLFDTWTSFGVRPRALWAWVALHDGLAATLHVQLDSAAEAQQLATKTQGQVGLIAPMVDAIDLAAEDADVVLTLSISDQKLQTLLGLLP